MRLGMDEDTPYEPKRGEIAGIDLYGMKTPNGWVLGAFPGQKLDDLPVYPETPGKDGLRVFPELPKYVTVCGNVYTLEATEVGNNLFFNAMYA